MAGRRRDHAAEKRRRDELAQARGFRSRSAERHAKGKVQQGAGQAPWQRAGFDSNRAYMAARREARIWSVTHSQQENSRYNPKMSPETFGRYYRGMVGPGDYRSYRRQHLIDYMVLDRGMDRAEAEGQY